MAGIKRTIEIPMNKVTERILFTVKITGLKAWTIRRNIGAFLLKLAAWVMGVKVNIDINIEEASN